MLWCFQVLRITFGIVDEKWHDYQCGNFFCSTGLTRRGDVEGVSRLQPRTSHLNNLTLIKTILFINVLYTYIASLNHVFSSFQRHWSTFCCFHLSRHNINIMFFHVLIISLKTIFKGFEVFLRHLDLSYKVKFFQRLAFFVFIVFNVFLINNQFFVLIFIFLT